MNVTKNELPKSQVELVIELSVDELKPYLDEAAKEISKSKNIQGFRPGKAPFDMIVKEVGEMTVYQTAGNFAVEGTVFKAIEQEDLEIIDQPSIEVQKLAPNNPFTYKATISLMPEMTIADYDKISVKPAKETPIEEKDIEKVLTDLQKMRSSEVLADKKAEKGDSVELNFDTSVDNVPIEGGKAEKHKLEVGSGQMIPGFEDNVEGLKAGEEKEFELAFPKEYHAKHLAGKKALFKIKVTSVFTKELPEINDEFAKALGLKDVEGLKGQIKTNIQAEKDNKEKQRIELELIEKLIDESKFSDLPESLINQETHKMIHEMQDNIARQGMKFEDYLANMKKTEADLRLDFTPDAIKRVKTALLIRSIAIKEDVKVEDKDVEAEKEKALASYKLNPAFAPQLEELEKNIKTPQATQYFKNLLTNRKTMELLKDKIVEKK